MEFFKALNTLHHSPSIYKLNVYGFDKRSLEFTKSNHTNTKLRCKAVHFSIQWSKIKSGFLLNSVVGPLVFNTFVNHTIDCNRHWTVNGVIL